MVNQISARSESFRVQDEHRSFFALRLRVDPNKPEEALYLRLKSLLDSLKSSTRKLILKGDRLDPLLQDKRQPRQQGKASSALAKIEPLNVLAFLEFLFEFSRQQVLPSRDINHFLGC